MAIYNEILTGRYARALQKLFGIKGTVPAKQLAGEIMPVHQVFNGAENRYLEGWNRFGLIFTVTAAAGFVSGLRLRNPAGSNTIFLLEKLLVNGNTGGTATEYLFTLGAQTADLAVAVGNAASRMDSRGNPNPVAVTSQQNTTAAITAQACGIARCLLNSSGNFDAILFEDEEVPLLPGDAIQIVSSAANVALTATIQWRERFLEESERA